ncbi:MAG: ABC-F family ATP-binding cassette domain-containing protein [Spirochaetaceae bacterium]|nr:ABC-F family ATP-binding cassette domain-containing protein [Spirochaetaceae bacterium]
MAFVQFSHVSLAFGDRDILKDVVLNLASGNKAALAGANGSGKTTLMKVLCGIIQPDSGERAVQKGTRTAYLPQSDIIHKGRTLRAEAETAFSRGIALSAELERLADEMSRCSEVETPKLLEKYHETQTALEESGWENRVQLAAQVLAGLGFSQEDLDRDTGEFSGGWQMRIALAKILLERPDILLLDEPTNYLDLEARTWLEQWLRNFEGGFLLVSHDRFFLDVTVTDVYELFGGVLRRYPGNYSHYEQVRAVELQSLVARYMLQQEEIRKIEDFARRFRYKPTKAAQVQERLKQLEKMERIEIPEGLKKIQFRFPPAPHSGRLVLTLENVSRSYGSRHVIQDLSMTVENGERLVVVGRNGAGKSTLLRAIAGVDPEYTGVIKAGAGVSIGYFSQDSAASITGTQSMLEMLESEAPLELIPKIRDLLGAFLFRGDDVYKSVSVLSGGEKSRLALLRLLLRPVNLLILDEPTNHLDLSAKDVLLWAIKEFGGTVLFVSHDRDFIESLATRVLELTVGTGGQSAHNTSRQFPGGYRYYLERIAAEEAGEIPAAGSSSIPVMAEQKKAVSVSSAEGATSGGSSWEEEKRKRSERRRLEREEARLLDEIAAAEEKKQSLEEQLNSPDVYSDPERSRLMQQEIAAAEILLTDLAEKWEQAALRL